MNDRVLGHGVESTALTHTSTTLSDSETVYDVTASSTTVCVCWVWGKKERESIREFGRRVPTSPHVAA